MSERGAGRYPLAMTAHDAQMDAILELLEGAGLVEVYIDDDGTQAMRLTE